MAAASETVQMPPKIRPSTMIGMKRAQMLSFKMYSFSFMVALGC